VLLTVDGVAFRGRLSRQSIDPLRNMRAAPFHSIS